MNSSQRSGRPTRLGVRSVRADLLFRCALRHADDVHTLDDLRALCPSWSHPMFLDAIDRNVALGRLSESASGRLLITDPLP